MWSDLGGNGSTATRTRAAFFFPSRAAWAVLGRAAHSPQRSSVPLPISIALPRRLVYFAYDVRRCGRLAREDGAPGLAHRQPKLVYGNIVVGGLLLRCLW